MPSLLQRWWKRESCKNACCAFWKKTNDGAPVSLTASVGGVKRTWEGKLVRSEGILDTGSRVVYAIVEVQDPYNLKSSHNAPLRFGQFVEAEITSRQNEELVVLPRSILRLDNTVLTVNDNREIEIKPVEEIILDLTLISFTKFKIKSYLFI